jgi:hypothetical protein
MVRCRYAGSRESIEQHKRTELKEKEERDAVERALERAREEVGGEAGDEGLEKMLGDMVGASGTEASRCGWTGTLEGVDDGIMKGSKLCHAEDMGELGVGELGKFMLLLLETACVDAGDGGGGDLSMMDATQVLAYVVSQMFSAQGGSRVLTTSKFDASGWVEKIVKGIEESLRSGTSGFKLGWAYKKSLLGMLCKILDHDISWKGQGGGVGGELRGGERGSILMALTFEALSGGLENQNVRSTPPPPASLGR